MPLSVGKVTFPLLGLEKKSFVRPSKNVGLNILPNFIVENALSGGEAIEVAEKLLVLSLSPRMLF
ncbi:MAG: hypothetical protein IPO07_13960 [Haliscomenobacter sp.]|nr:hypothetical protein [Haliscomenobacter sp.]MBK9489755.1 hypothetical protein [Haliscomenobacter sp.]